MDDEQWDKIREQFDYLGEFFEGLAVAENDNEFFHVKEDGTPAYAQRHRFTQDFYCGRATASTDEGCFHIKANGERAYPQTYGDVASFQDGKAWVIRKGQMAQIDKDGKQITPWMPASI